MTDKIYINENIFLKESDFEIAFVHAGGPGGQKVNKTASAVQLKFNPATSSLPESLKSAIFRRFQNRITNAGEIIINASTNRSQGKNREEAIRRLVNIIQSAARPVKKRKKTKPSKTANKRRLDNKKKRSEIKQKRSFRYSPDGI